MKKFHFCSGLPRTGSTLLMNLLQQNPKIFTTSTDAFPEILQEQILIKSRYRESFQAMSCEQADKAVYGMALGATKGWYEGLTSKPVVLSKSRIWPDLYHLFPESKFIVTIRDLRDIVESFDKLNTSIKALHSFGESNILYGSMSESEKYRYHFNEMNSFSSTLQHSIPKLVDLYKKNCSKVKFVRYEDLLKDPHYMLKRIYDFLEIEPFSHCLDNINQSQVFEHDNAYFREKTSHYIQPKIVKWSTPNRKLSQSFHSKILKDYEWFYHSFYPETL